MSPDERSWSRRAALVGAPLALAAAVVLYFVTRSTSPVIPPYDLSASDAAGSPPAAAGGPATNRIHMGSKDARFEIVARPASASAAKVVAFPFAMIGGEPVPLEAKVDISPDGAVRIAGGFRALEGASEIRIVLGSIEAIGKFDDAHARANKGASDDHVRVLTVAIDRPAPQ